MKPLIRYLNRLDLVLSLGSLGWGLWFQNYWALAGGVLGLLMTWYNPAEKLQAKLQAKFLRKGPPPSDASALLAEDLFYRPTGDATDSDAAPAEVPAPSASLPTYSLGPLPPSVYLNPSKHNWMTAPSLQGRPSDAPGVGWG